MKFDQYGLPEGTLPTSSKNTDESSIFKTHEVKQGNRLDARGAGTAKAVGLAQQMHKISHHESAEPDWQGLMLNASGGIEKMQIKEAKAAWQEEKKWKAHLEAEAAMQQRIDAIKQTPNRNQAFYRKLQASDGRVYWSTEVQRQMRSDKSAQGLNWFSKK